MERSFPSLSSSSCLLRVPTGDRHTTVILSRYKPLKDLTRMSASERFTSIAAASFSTKSRTTESIRGRFKIEKRNAPRRPGCSPKR